MISDTCNSGALVETPVRGKEPRLRREQIYRLGHMQTWASSSSTSPDFPSASSLHSLVFEFSSSLIHQPDVEVLMSPSDCAKPQGK